MGVINKYVKSDQSDKTIRVPLIFLDDLFQ
jgi:hypothetical protein